MNRLEKKCLIASTGSHLLLLVILLAGVAFLPDKTNKPNNLPALRVVPSKLVDGLLSGGGGNPQAPETEGQKKLVAPVPPPQIPTPTPVKPPEPVRTEVKKAAPPEPIKKPPVKPAKEPLKEAVKKETKPAPVPNKNAKPDLGKVVVRDPGAKARAEAEAKSKAEAKERAALLAKQLNKTVQNLNDGLSKGTVVDIRGPGGEAYANYAQWVKTVYEDAWDPADDLMDNDSTAQVTVTIAKNGDVITARLIKRSGTPALDKSVQRALDKVRTIGRPFPEGAKEDQRTFNINFNLKAKRLSG
ncbi:MAG TPA: TonB family protein [Verrucomicrobiae bacterium]